MKSFPDFFESISIHQRHFTAELNGAPIQGLLVKDYKFKCYICIGRHDCFGQYFRTFSHANKLKLVPFVVACKFFNLGGNEMNLLDNDLVRGAIYGHAIGDALGLGAEFMSKMEVQRHYPKGLRCYDDILSFALRDAWQRGALFIYPNSARSVRSFQ